MAQSDASETGKAQDPNRATQSRLHRRVAQLEKELEEREVRLRTAEQTISILKENGATDENVDLAKKLAGREAELNRRQKQVEETARAVVIDSLVAQYNIPREELEELSDPREMRVTAREWALEHRETAKSQETGAEAAEAKPSGKKPEGEAAASKEPEEKPADNSGFDLGTGIATVKSVANMSPEEFAAHENKVEAAIAARASRQR